MKRSPFQQVILWLCVACFGLGATLLQSGVVICIGNDGSMRLEFSCSGGSEAGCPVRPGSGETEREASSPCSDVSLGAAKPGASRHSEQVQRSVEHFARPMPRWLCAKRPAWDSVPAAGPRGLTPAVAAWRTVRIQV